MSQQHCRGSHCHYGRSSGLGEASARLLASQGGAKYRAGRAVPSPPQKLTDKPPRYIEMSMLEEAGRPPRRWANRAQVQRVHRRLGTLRQKPSSNLEQQLLQDRLFEIIEAD